jgi:hypothetical protein
MLWAGMISERHIIGREFKVQWQITPVLSTAIDRKFMMEPILSNRVWESLLFCSESPRPDLQTTRDRNQVELTTPMQLYINSGQKQVTASLLWLGSGQLIFRIPSKTMKKALIAALCSALVIPGLGQVINQQLKKGGCILASVFVLFLAGVFILYRLISSIRHAEEPTAIDFSFIISHLSTLDLSVLWFLLLAFTTIWLYAVLDAFLTARKLDQREKGKRL